MADKIRIGSKDLRGNYEPSDSEEELSQHERKLLDKVKKGRKTNDDSEEDVYGFSDSDEDSVKNDLVDIADSDVEGQENSEDDLPDSKAWGKQKRSYYSTDYVDEDYGGFGDHEEGALLEEEEATKIQKRLAQQLDQITGTFDVFTKKGESDTGVTKQKKEIEKESPEFAGLIEDFKTKLTVAKEDMHPVLELVKDGKLPKCPASKFVRTNYNLILNYCTNISFYVLLKSKNIDIQNHPVMKRLYQYRQMLDKMEPIYLDVIKPQIEKILNAVSNNLELHIKEIETRKRKNKNASESAPKKLKIIENLDKEGDDTGVSDQESDGDNDYFKEPIRNDESEESGFSDNEDTKDEIQGKPSEVVLPEDLVEKREITYQMAKNKGLTPHRNKVQRNPRVKHKLKYRKAKIRRKGAVREPRTELSRYGGEASGIKSNVKKSIKIK